MGAAAAQHNERGRALTLPLPLSPRTRGHQGLSHALPSSQVVGEDVDDEEDEAAVEQADLFEAAYNFRWGRGKVRCACVCLGGEDGSLG